MLELQKARSLKKDQPSLFALLAAELEGMAVGTVRTSNEIAINKRIHYLSVKKYLKFAYFCQNFIPRIRLFKEAGKLCVKVESLPGYAVNILPPRDRILLKLLLRMFNAKLPPGSPVNINSLNLSDDELYEINNVGFPSHLAPLVSEGSMSLTPDGVAAAWKIMAQLADLRDNFIQDFVHDEDMLDNIENLESLRLQRVKSLQGVRVVQVGVDY